MGPLYFWRNVFDNKIKLIVNEDGIWFNSLGFVVWDRVWYYYFRVSESNKAGKFCNLIFKIRNDGKDYNLDITFLDKNNEQICQAFKENGEKHGVYFLGLEGPV